MFSWALTFVSEFSNTNQAPMNRSKSWRLNTLLLSLPLWLSVRGQLVYYYDASGSMTNTVLNSTASLGTTVTNSSGTLLTGDSLSLAVAATGSGPISYQWLLNGSTISGATNATFFKGSVAPGDAGVYSVVTTGSTGSRTNQAGTIAVLAATNTLYAVSYGLSKYVAVGANGAVESSPDLIAWTAGSSGTTNDLHGLTFASSTFVAVGALGTVLTSANGTSWTVRTSGVTNDLNGVTFANSLFVAVGSGGTVITSANGTTWTRQTFDNPTLEAVTYGNSLFVTVGTGGSIWSSTSGVNWTGHDYPVTNVLSGVAFGGGKFVAAGSGGLILTSTDGTNWTAYSSGTQQAFESVLYFNGTFYAIGPGGLNYISADGINWGDSDAGTFDLLMGAVMGNSNPVAVGENGGIVQMPYSLIDHFTWNVVGSPQRAGQPFSVTITARDAANNALANYNGLVGLAETSLSWSTNNVLGTLSTNYFVTGTNTSGYAFTPASDILVTQLRHYDVAKSVSVWNEDGDLLASVTVTNSATNWVSTPLTVPLQLKGGTTYVIGAHSDTGHYEGSGGSTGFADGTIDQSFTIITNDDTVFPALPISAFWVMVDLTYVVQHPNATTISPLTATLVNGVATFNASVTNAGDGVTLTAADNAGHYGVSGPFQVYATNDLGLTLTAAPSPASVLSNLTYTVKVMNSGTSSSTLVNITNTLPAGITNVSASSTQGTCQVTNGLVTCSVGTLASGAAVTLTIVGTPSVPGSMLTNTATATRHESDPNSADNSATISTFVPPTLSIADLSVYEGNVGINSTSVLVTASSAIPLAMDVTATTFDGTNATPAVAGRDYIGASSLWVLKPGFSSFPIPIQIQGNVLAESNKQFYVRLSDATDATIIRSQSTVTILNDDGLLGQVQNLVWNTISSPQRTNQALLATITARDGSGSVVTSFATNVNLRGINVGGPSSRTMITNTAYAESDNLGSFTVGYQFTPTNDIYITHVRSYAGSKVTIWNDTGYPLLSQSVASVPGTWVETPLPTPVVLSAGTTNRIGVYTAGNTYYWRKDGSPSFPNGSILRGYSSPADAFPTNADAAEWYMVDIRYVPAAAMTPAVSGNFTSGAWTGNIAVWEFGTNYILMADDRSGHLGFSNPFAVYQTNDLAVSLVSSPQVPVIGTNITYTNTVLNPGPSTSTTVTLTNTLPSGATYVSATSSQGTVTHSGGLVTAALGSISALSSATVTIVITPLVAGLPLTNSVTVTRTESDANLADNSAVSIVIPSIALTVQLAAAADYSATPWRSGGDALWQSQTTTTHDGISAAQSGPISNSQQSWMETTLIGPGSLSFWWKVSSQAGGDLLYFYTNSVAVTNISGSVGWQQQTYTLSPGSQVLRWSYIKDASVSSGSDAGWLDQVVFTVPSFNFTSWSMATNGSFSFTVSGTNGQVLVLQDSSSLSSWTSLSTNTVSSGVINYTDTTATNAPYRFYRALFRNQ